ncbi:MAG: hypothetical protein VB112_00450 [Oscillospiraceae bacterium]|nr:hypothetical protein [Oscillospiraceae bacterium]
MKRFVPVLFIFCTALAVAAGFFLPGFVSAMQDQELKTKISTYEAASLQFHPVAQLKDSLQLLAGEYTTVNLDGGSNLDTDGAHQAALDTLKFLTEHGAVGILSEGYSGHTETPVLAVSADKTMSAILWRCGLYNDRAGRWIDILIDDNSGKMLAFSIISDQKIIFGQARKNVQEQAHDFSGKLASICTDYYGWKIEDVQLGDAVQLDNSSGYSIKGSISISDDTDDLLTFPLTIFGNRYAFNSTPILGN